MKIDFFFFFELADANPKVYISYATQDRELVQKIVNEIKPVLPKLDIWTDYEQTRNGWDFEDCMKAIEDSDFVICFISDFYKQSQSCEAEAQHANSREKEMFFVKIKQPCEPTGWLIPIMSNHSPMQFAMRYRTFEHSMDELLKQIRVIIDKVKAPSGGSAHRPKTKQQKKEIVDDGNESLDDKIVSNCVTRIKLRRFDALKLTKALSKFNSLVFDSDFIADIAKAQEQDPNGGIFELAKKLGRTEGKAFILTARAARLTKMMALAELLEDTVIDFSIDCTDDEEMKHAAGLILQLFEDLDQAGHLSRRKQQMVDKIKRYNIPLYRQVSFHYKSPNLTYWFF